MRLIFHGELRKLYGKSVTMACDTIADAIEGFSSQQENWPRSMRICAVGYDTVEALNTYAEEVDLMPAMSGGGGKFGAIIMGAAIIGLSFALPGIGIGLSVALKTSLIVSGAMMIAQGVMGLFMKSPSMSKNADPEASKYFGITQNTTAVGTPIMSGWGRVGGLRPHWLSLQSDSTNLSYGVFPANPS